MPLTSNKPSKEINQDYVPINCTFHDRLEDYSIRRSIVEAKYVSNNVVLTKTVCIKDVFARDNADYAILQDQEKQEELVRLDQLISVNGFKLATDSI